MPGISWSCLARQLNNPIAKALHKQARRCCSNHQGAACVLVGG
jgi:hypothetical protein